MKAGRLILTLASVVVVVAGLKAAAALLVPFMVAVFLSLLSLPLLGWLQRRMPRGLAVLLTVLANLALIVGLFALVSGSISGFVDAVPRYRVRLEELFADSLAWLDSHGVPASDWWSEEGLNPAAVVDVLGSTLRGLASVVTNLVLVVLTMVFLLLEVACLPSKLQAALGISRDRYERYASASEQVQRYLVIKTGVSILTGVLAGLGVWLVGLDFPLLWALVAFLFNYVPNLGSIIAAIPPVLLALVQLGVGQALVIALIYAVINIVLGNLIEPQLQGRRLGLSPLVVFLSLVFWGWVWGPVGMVLSVPLTVVVRIVLENSEKLQWVAVLLAARPPEGAVEATRG